MTVRNHFTNKIDTRYSVGLYSPGRGIQVAAYFRHERIGFAPTKTEAWEIAQEHYDNHKIDGAISHG